MDEDEIRAQIRAYLHDWLAEHITQDQIDAWLREEAARLADESPEHLVSVEELNALVKARVQAQLLDRQILGRRLAGWLFTPELED